MLSEDNTGRNNSREISFKATISCSPESITNSLSISRVKTRLQVQVKRKPTDTAPTGVDATHYTSTWDAISKIVADDGIIGLYTGINGALIGVASTNFAYFYWYSVVRTLYLSSQ